MYNREKTLRDRSYSHDKQNPSFSSTLLDKIYRSIDEGDHSGGELKFPPVEKQSRSWAAEEEDILSLRQACLLDKWMEQNAKEKISLRNRHHFYSELDKNSSMLDHDYDHHDALFFSSGTNSSDSSSGGLSFSDTESFYNPKPTKSCFSRPKPIRVGPEKMERRDHFSSATDQETPKSKSRVLRMYGNLKKPISPGGRLSSFLNTIFTGNGKRSKNPSSTDDVNAQRGSKSVQPLTCSSASSFSRSCLSNHSLSSSEKLRNEAKRSVGIVEKDLRPRGQKSLYELKLMSASVPTSRNISRKKDDAELKLEAMEESRRVEEAATDILKQYHQNQSKRSDCDRYDDDEEEEDDDDDDASCASSDLFELDHLAVIGDRYREELPVYETTRVDRNRAISNSSFV